MRKKLLSLLLSAAMLCSFIALPAAAEEPAGTWYDEAMTVWSERGVLRGDANGNLNPTASITRAELAVMMDRIMVYQTVAENTFADVENGTWYTAAVLKANAAGVLQGSGAYARPLDTITRQEVMVLMARVLNLDGKPDAVASFADAGQVASWARDAVGAMVSAGYISGNNGNIMPTANITRAEVAVMMNNIFGAVYAQAGTYTEDVDASVVINTDQVILKDITISGDLIVAEGVGSGKVTLDNVVVKGRIIVRGGDVITMQGSSTADTIVAERQDDPTEISLEDKTHVGTVIVPEDSADHTVIDVNKDAQVDDIIIGADNTDLNVSGKVRTVTVDDTANGTTVNAEKGAKIDSVITSGEDTSVEGKGTVSKVEATEDASDTTVTTPGTKVENNSSEPVTTDKGTIGAGETGTTSGGGSSGGSSGGGSQPSHTPSTLTTNIGEQTFYTGVPTEFTFTTTANDDAGKMVIGTSDFSDDSAIEKLEYYEVKNGQWYELTGDFGPSTGFPMSNATSRFRVTFKTAGSYTFTASMKLADGGAVLCSTNVAFTVADAPADVSLVKSEEELNRALTNDAITVIELGGSFSVTKEITVTRPVTIDGNGFTIDVGTESWSSDNSDKHLLDVNADNVTIKNLTLDSESKAYGLQGYQASDIALENVAVLNSKGTGLTINGSSVNATGLTISGSGWGQSIDITSGASLTLDNVSTLKDLVQIAQDGACDADVTVGGNRWYAENYYILLKDAFKYIYSADVTEAQHGQIRVPAGNDAKENGKLLQATMVAAPANSIIAVSSGTYDLPRDMDTAVSAGQNQTGWYFAIQQDGLKLVGENMPVLTSTVYSANGNWANQNFITIFGNNVTLDGFIIKGKMDSNKTIEINGMNTTLRNLEIRCNDIITHEEYLAQMAPDAADYWEGYSTSCAGSVCFGGDVGKAVLDNVYIEKSWLSTSGATGGEITMKDVTLDFAGSWYSGINLPISANAATYLKNGSELTVVVDDLTDLNALFSSLPEGAVVQLTAGEYQTEAGSWIINKALTLEGREGAVLNSKLAVSADGVTLKDITMNVTMTAAEQSAPITSTGNFTLVSCDISRTTEVAQPYGYLVDVEGKLAASNTVFTAPYDPATAFNDSPSVIEAGEVDLDGCTIATDGYGLFSEHVTKGIIKNTVFTGINGRPTLGCFNSTLLNGLVFDGCTFHMGENSIVAAGNFTIKNSTFDFTNTPADGAGNGINLYAQNGPVVLTGNTFKLTEGKKGINLTSATWASGNHDASQVTITGNTFEGTGNCAIKVSETWTNVPTADAYAGSNTLNGNMVDLPTA